jgi:hypothetical protein
MKNQLKEIAFPDSLDSVAHKMRNHATAFHRSVRTESMKFKEFKKFCEKCDATIIVRKPDGTEIKF